MTLWNSFIELTLKLTQHMKSVFTLLAKIFSNNARERGSSFNPHRHHANTTHLLNKHSKRSFNRFLVRADLFHWRINPHTHTTIIITMNSFKTELFKVSFHAEKLIFSDIPAVTIEKLNDESYYSTFTNFNFLCAHVCELNQTCKLDKKEAAKIMHKAALYLLD